MKKSELSKLRKLLEKETTRRKRINQLLSKKSIQEFLSLNNFDVDELPSNDINLILEEILEDFPITETNGILVCTGSYMTKYNICYEDYDYYEQEVSFDNEYAHYQMFKDIETNKIRKAYCDSYVKQKIEESNKYSIGPKMTPSEFCNGKYLVSELIKDYTVLNPYNSSENENGFGEVQKDFYITAIKYGQPKAKKLILEKYTRMR